MKLQSNTLLSCHITFREVVAEPPSILQQAIVEIQDLILGPHLEYIFESEFDMVDKIPGG